MRQDVVETLEVTPLELLRSVYPTSDLEAWAESQQDLEKTVLTWFHKHPGCDAVCHVHSDKYFIALAFEQLRQAIIQRKIACETLSEVLVYLRTGLNAALMDTLRDVKQSEVVSSLCPDGEGRTVSNELWERPQARLFSERDRRLAYLLYHCGLSAAEIVRSSSQEWSDIQEVMELKRSILARLMNGYGP